MWANLQTMQMTYQHICAGQRPWTALGDFLNYWYSYTTDQRAELVYDPLLDLGETPELRRWAAFCAASVEYLCQKYDIPCPDWVHNPAYTLSERWFTGLGAKKPNVQARLLQETPEPFASRNVYCGNRMFANKYETAEHYQRVALATPVLSAI